MSLKKNLSFESKESLISSKKYCSKNEFSPRTSTIINGEESLTINKEILQLNKISECSSTLKLPKEKSTNKKLKGDIIEKQEITLSQINKTDVLIKKTLKMKDKKNPKLINDKEDEPLSSKTPTEALFDDCFIKEKSSEEKSISSIQNSNSAKSSFNKEKSSDDIKLIDENKKIEKSNFTLF